MSRGRHAAPSEHRLGRAIATTGTLAAVTTGGMAVITPAMAQAAPAVDVTGVLPAPPAAPAAASTYTVAAGDFLSRIGPAVGEDWRQLYQDNAAVIGGDPNLIFPGQVLTVAAPAVVAPPVGAHAVTGQAAVDLARHELGDPYVYGAEGPSSFDCSGLVQYVYAQLGVDLPRTSLAQSAVGDRVASLADAQPGDLLFFYSPVGHVGIYIGGGQMIAAPEPGDVVKVQSVWATPTVIRRVL